jgi:membrane associated rhomboid family serine protease
MPQNDQPVETAGDPPTEELAEAGVYASASEGFDHGLVVLAMGRPYWLVPAGARFRLLVEARGVGEVGEELACYDRESVGWPPRPHERAPARSFELATPLIWAASVVGVYCCQCLWPGSLEDAGELDSGAVFGRGEWWRAVTALFLHADVGHLVSNALSGTFAFGAVISTFGRARGWICVAVAGAAGNLAIAALNYPGPYRSLGASTAIFAGLGLLTGRAVRAVRRDRTPRSWRALLAPLAAGTALLGLYGAGGLNIDVGAHAAGFLSGLALGFAAGMPAPRTGEPPAS